MNRSPTSSPWAIASLSLALLVVVAFILLRGSHPLLLGAGAPSTNRFLWSLPGWLALVSVGALLLGSPAALACAVIAYKQRGRRPLSATLVFVGCFLVTVFLVLCFA